MNDSRNTFHECCIVAEMKMNLAQAIKGSIHGQPSINYVRLLGFSTKMHETGKKLSVNGNNYESDIPYEQSFKFVENDNINSKLQFHITNILVTCLKHLKCWIELF